jgi:hypothetical protein
VHDVVVIVCVAFDHRAPPAELATFKNCIFACPFVDSAMEVTGSYDLIVRGHCESLVQYNQNFEAIRPQIAKLVARFETNFVSLEVHRGPRTEHERFIWLPCESGLKRVAVDLIDKVVAEGDYMRVHVGTWSCLVHQTLRKLWQELGVSDFVQLHRSLLVRVQFIERFVHVERRWKARLHDGTTIPVAKSHVHDVLRLTRSESSTNGSGLPKIVPAEVQGETV